MNGRTAVLLRRWCFWHSRSPWGDRRPGGHSIRPAAAVLSRARRFSGLWFSVCQVIAFSIVTPVALIAFNLAICLSPRTVGRYPRLLRPRRGGSQSQRWTTFVRNHASAVAVYLASGHG